MENILGNLKGNIEFLLDLQKEISMLNERLTWYNSIGENRIYNPIMCEKIKGKLDGLYKKYFEMKNLLGLK